MSIMLNAWSFPVYLKRVFWEIRHHIVVFLSDAKDFGGITVN